MSDIDPSARGWRRVLRSAISRLACFTPGVFYYAADFPAEINGTLKQMPVAGESGSGMSKAALAMCCAFSEELKEGDEATFTLRGVTIGGNKVGSFVVTVERMEA